MVENEVPDEELENKRKADPYEHSPFARPRTKGQWIWDNPPYDENNKE